MSDTKDLQYFKDEVAAELGPFRGKMFKYYLMNRNPMNPSIEEIDKIVTEAAERYAAHLQAQAFNEGCEACERDYFAGKLIRNAVDPNSGDEAELFILPLNIYKTQSNEPENN